MKSQHGFSLVEILIAGAIVALVVTATFRGIISSTHICHDNAQLIAAEAYAWETAWIWLNKNYEALPVNETKTFSISSEDCPAISRENSGAAASCVIKVLEYKDTTAVMRHGEPVATKKIDVNVIWGPSNNRRSLNNLGSNFTNAGIPISIYKSAINRNK